MDIKGKTLWTQDWTVLCIFIKLGIHVIYNERMNPIAFRCQKSKVKVIYKCGVRRDATLCVVIFNFCSLSMKTQYGLHGQQKTSSKVNFFFFGGGGGLIISYTMHIPWTASCLWGQPADITYLGQLLAFEASLLTLHTLDSFLSLRPACWHYIPWTASCLWGQPSDITYLGQLLVFEASLLTLHTLDSFLSLRPAFWHYIPWTVSCLWGQPADITYLGQFLAFEASLLADIVQVLMPLHPSPLSVE